MSSDPAGYQGPPSFNLNAAVTGGQVHGVGLTLGGAPRGGVVSGLKHAHARVLAHTHN